MKNLIFEKSDILRIGHTGFNEGGKTAILCNLDTANIEEILLRNILKCFGENYKIVETLDYPQTADIEQVEAIEFITNLPYETYMQDSTQIVRRLNDNFLLVKNNSTLKDRFAIADNDLTPVTAWYDGANITELDDIISLSDKKEDTEIIVDSFYKVTETKVEHLTMEQFFKLLGDSKK